MRFDLSTHVHFFADELLARLIKWHDEQPLWDSTLTMEEGSTTVRKYNWFNYLLLLTFIVTRPKPALLKDYYENAVRQN